MGGVAAGKGTKGGFNKNPTEIPCVFPDRRATKESSHLKHGKEGVFYLKNGIFCHFCETFEKKLKKFDFFSAADVRIFRSGDFS